MEVLEGGRVAVGSLHRAGNYHRVRYCPIEYVSRHSGGLAIGSGDGVRQICTSVQKGWTYGGRCDLRYYIHLHCFELCPFRNKGRSWFCRDQLVSRVPWVYLFRVLLFWSICADLDWGGALPEECGAGGTRSLLGWYDGAGILFVYVA